MRSLVSRRESCQYDLACLVFTNSLLLLHVPLHGILFARVGQSKIQAFQPVLSFAPLLATRRSLSSPFLPTSSRVKPFPIPNCVCNISDRRSSAVLAGKKLLNDIQTLFIHPAHWVIAPRLTPPSLQAQQRLDDNTPSVLGGKIMDKIDSRHEGGTVLLVIK